MESRLLVWRASPAEWLGKTDRSSYSQKVDK
jgi:hypothetical protein